MQEWTLRGRLREWGMQLRSLIGLGKRAEPQHSVAFTGAFVALGAKMAKADGVAVLAEWEAFERFLEVPQSERANVRRLYNLASQDAAGAQEHARRISDMFGDDLASKRNVIECLLFVACSDGILHQAEDEFLNKVARSLGFSHAEFRVLRAQFVKDPDSPYEVLGLSPDASDEAVKAAYRSAAVRSHPDHLIAAGAEAAVIKAATAKLARLNAAYDQIVEERRAARHQ